MHYSGPPYGNDELLEFVDQVVVLPRLCEHCLEHPAVFYWTAWWPTSWLCRPCCASWLSQLERWVLHGETS